MKVASQETSKITTGVIVADTAGKINAYARARYAFMAGRFFFALSPWGLAFVVATLPISSAVSIRQKEVIKIIFSRKIRVNPWVVSVITLPLANKG